MSRPSHLDASQDLGQEISSVLNHRQDVHSQSQRPFEHFTEIRGSLAPELALEPCLFFMHSDSKEAERYPASLQLSSDGKSRLVLEPSPGHLSFAPAFDSNGHRVAQATEVTGVLDDL